MSDPEHFFEGVEKLLEIWFVPNANADLRSIPRPMWDEMLKEVRCEIISFSRNELVDAYVLSESSMFVSKRRWILKTCGTTTPLQCLERLLRLAAGVAGYVEIEELFYSRKNFKRPELQVAPHRDFEEEVAMLDSYFDAGRAYCLGAVNKDCWYLYTMSRRGSGGHSDHGAHGEPDRRTPKRIDALIGGLKLADGEEEAGGKDEQEANTSSSDNDSDEISSDDGLTEEEEVERRRKGKAAAVAAVDHQNEVERLEQQEEMAFNPDPDQTIEILMTELDPKVMEIFTKDVCMTGQEATEKSGIDKILPGMKIDDYLFDPCGYSMNGIARNGCYMTIHITPEQEFSYVSFETNVAASDYGDLITRVIETFQPGKFVVTILANKTSPAFSASRAMEHSDKIRNWKRRDIQFCRLASYDLIYCLYTKFPS